MMTADRAMRKSKKDLILELEKRCYPFPCKLCDETFPKELDLLLHFKITHLKDFDFEQFDNSEDKVTKKEDEDEAESEDESSSSTSMEKDPGDFLTDLERKFLEENKAKETSVKVEEDPQDSDLGEDDSHYVVKNWKLNFGTSFKEKYNLDKPPFPCGTCDKRYTTYHKLDIHLKSLGHSANIKNRTPYICPNCKKCWTTPANLQRHMLTHYPAAREVAKVECEHCGKRYTKQDNLTLHIINCHPGMLFKCKADDCTKAFPTRRKLEIHETIHEFNLTETPTNQSIDKRPYKCGQCGSGWPNIRDFQRHVKTHDTNPNRFRCRICKGSFPNSDILATHMVCKHPDVNPLQCEVCNKIFAKTNNLTRHMKTHMKKESFQCKICEKDYSRRDALLVHMKSIHPSIHWRIRT